MYVFAGIQYQNYHCLLHHPLNVHPSICVHARDCQTPTTTWPTRPTDDRRRQRRTINRIKTIKGLLICSQDWVNWRFILLLLPPLALLVSLCMQHSGGCLGNWWKRIFKSIVYWKLPKCQCVVCTICVCVSWVVKGQNVTKAWRCVVKYPIVPLPPKGLWREKGMGVVWDLAFYYFVLDAWLRFLWFPCATLDSVSKSRSPLQSDPRRTETVTDFSWEGGKESLVLLLRRCWWLNQFSSKGCGQQRRIGSGLVWPGPTLFCYATYSCATCQADTQTDLPYVCIIGYKHTYISLSTACISIL